MKSFFERAGIYGYSYPIERAMLASCITGTPVLLLGRIGEAKTKSAEVLASLLLGDLSKFQKIAADKAQFEDMVGFPNPKSLAEGHMTFVKSDITIWDKEFVLVDEISRCNPQMQNKFLELVLERQVLGIPTGVRWVWATMNPLDYPGSHPLDGALAGRMGYVIEVPKMVDHNADTIEQIIASKNYAQTPALSYWAGKEREYTREQPAALQAELRALMEKASTVMLGLEDHWNPVVTKYLRAFAVSMSSAGLALDGRRMVMMRYNIISNIAIQTVQQGRALRIDEVKQLCKEVIPLSIPWLATGLKESFDKSKFYDAHKLASDFLDSGDSLIYQIVTEQDNLTKMVMYMANREKIESTTALSLLGSLYTKVSSSDPEELLRLQAEQFALQIAIPYLFLQLPDISSELVGLAAKNYPVSFSIERDDLGSISIRNYKEAQTLAEIYNRLKGSPQHKDWAMAAWAFYPPKDANWNFAYIISRIEYLKVAIEKVTNALHIYLPEKVANVSAADALTDLLQEASGTQEANPHGSGLSYATAESSGSPFSI